MHTDSSQPCAACRLLLEALSSLRGSLRGRGSELLFSRGCTEAAVGRLVALAAGAGSTHVALHHYMQPGAASAELEDAVAARFAAVAAQHGEYGLGPMRVQAKGLDHGCSSGQQGGSLQASLGTCV